LSSKLHQDKRMVLPKMMGENIVIDLKRCLQPLI